MRRDQQPVRTTWKAARLCGIAGGCGAQIDKELLRRMCNIIVHRGPDDEGYYVEDDVALGVRRLSIIDLETGGQPIHNEDETLWLVFNGEVFNYVELRAELESRHKFYTKSDTEVIVHLYEELGERCLKCLNGMFAFALWDRKKRKLFLARDRIGVKPLYYSFRDGGLIFGSEVKAILAAGFSAKPDNRAILDYMTLGYVLEDKTFFEGISQVPAGHYGTLEGGIFKIEQYWDLEYRAIARSEKENIRKLRKLLMDAVSIRLRSDVPLGCHLSGGIDSSAVTCMASQLLGKQVKTFTGAFSEGPQYDESSYSKIVSKRAGTEYHEVRPDGKDFIQMIDKLTWYMDYPEVGTGIYPQYYVCRLARKYVKVVLGGQGGDEIFGGYPWFIDVELEHIIARDRNPLRKLQAMITHLSIAKQNNRLLYEFTQLVARLISDRGMNLTDRFYHDRSVHSQADLSEMFTVAFRTVTKGYSPRSSFEKILNRLENDSFMDRAQYYYIKTYLAGLLHVEDRTSMAVSLESRVPLCCDHNLVEFAATLQPAMRMRGARVKHIFREAVKDIIPPEVYRRNDKKGFPTPYNIWLREQIDDVRKILMSEQARTHNVFDPQFVDKVLREHETGLRKRGFTIFMMLSVEFWFRNFIDEKEA